MKNSSIPPKINNNKRAKNGEVKPFSFRIRYETANNPSKIPRRELFNIKANREKIQRNKSVNVGIGIGS
jgi:hypothetical protein